MDSTCWIKVEPIEGGGEEKSQPVADADRIGVDLGINYKEYHQTEIISNIVKEEIQIQDEDDKMLRRSPNFTAEEVNRLIEFVEARRGVLENKRTDAATWKEKEEAWKNISAAFNASSVTPRTWEQLRAKYDALKKNARRALAAERQERLATGGAKRPTLNSVNYRLIKLLGIKSKVLNNPIDSDAPDERPTEADSNTVTTSVSQEIVIDGSSNQSMAGEMLMVTIDEDNEGASDYSSYSAQMLRKRKHPLLQTDCGLATKATDEEEASKIKPCSSRRRPKGDANKTFGALAQVKLQVASLQKQQMEETHYEKKQLEKEAHSLRMEILEEELKIKKEELEIKKEELKIKKLEVLIKRKLLENM